MAKARALDKRRKSIRNIRKITHTMELISTAQFRRAMNRAMAAGAYTERIGRLVANLARSGLEVSHPLLQPRAETNSATLLVLSANRGLCGGYNASVLRHATARWSELNEDVPQLRLEVSGKRGISGLKFRRIFPDEAYTHFGDRPAAEDVEVLANRYLEDFRAGRLDRLDVVYTKFESISKHYAVIETLLPLGRLDGADEDGDAQPGGESRYDFLPSAESILDEVVPASFRVKLLKCFLDAAVSEQVTRMLAMKAATENADTMISNLTMTYNRARQGQITSELLEVISGAEALSQ